MVEVEEPFRLNVVCPQRIPPSRSSLLLHFILTHGVQSPSLYTEVGMLLFEVPVAYVTVFQ